MFFRFPQTFLANPRIPRNNWRAGKHCDTAVSKLPQLTHFIPSGQRRERRTPEVSRKTVPKTTPQRAAELVIEYPRTDGNSRFSIAIAPQAIAVRVAEAGANDGASEDSDPTGGGL